MKLIISIPDRSITAIEGDVSYSFPYVENSPLDLVIKKVEEYTMTVVLRDDEAQRPDPRARALL